MDERLRVFTQLPLQAHDGNGHRDNGNGIVYYYRTYPGNFLRDTWLLTSVRPRRKRPPTPSPNGFGHPIQRPDYGRPRPGHSLARRIVDYHIHLALKAS